MEAFRHFASQRYALSPVDYPVLYAWSVQWRGVFWQAIVDFFKACS